METKHVSPFFVLQVETVKQVAPIERKSAMVSEIFLHALGSLETLRLSSGLERACRLSSSMLARSRLWTRPY